MRDYLSPVLEALDATRAPLDFFLRDDDAGWDDARLIALLQTSARAGVPIDLAAIPMAVSESLARELCSRIDAMPNLIGVHQHGYAHTNHQTEGRACEFGSARNAQMQEMDLVRGRAMLLRQFGSRLDSLFTPPWNRCVPQTIAALETLGYLAISRNRGALPQHSLPELQVDIDWCKHCRAGGSIAVANALATAIRDRDADAEPLGLMLHHAVMESRELDLLESWLSALARHSRVRWCLMGTLLTQRLSTAVLDEAVYPNSQSTS
jgi:hypothetical protein